MFDKVPAQYPKLLVGNMFFWYTMFLFMPVLPMYYHRLGMGKDEIGLAIGALNLGSFALRIWSGRAVDKYGGKRVLKAGFLLSTIFILCYLFADNVYSAIIVRFLHGASIAGYSSAALAGAAAMFPLSAATAAIAVFSLFSQIGGGLASGSALWIYENWSFFAVVMVGAAVSLLIFFFYPDLPEQERAEVDTTPPLPLTAFFRDKYVSVPTLTLLFTHSSYGAVMTFLPVFLVSGHLPGAAYFYMAYAISIVVTRFFVDRVCSSIPPHRLVLYIIISFALEIFVVAFFHQPVFLIFAGAWLGVAFGFAFPVLASVINRHASAATRGSAFAFFSTGSDIGHLFGAVAMGFLIEWGGHSLAFAGMGCWLLLYGLYYAKFLMAKMAEN